MKSKYLADASRMAENILKAASSGKPFVMFIHRSVDGDCIGAGCGMADVLRKMGAKAYVAMPEELLDIMEFLKVEDLLIYPGRDGFPYSDPGEYTAFGVDCSVGSRMGVCGEFFDRAENKLIIDHHVTVETEGDNVWIDGDASSASEICFYAVQELERMTGKDLLTPRGANCFLAGIVTDTGRFTYTNTRPETLEASGLLFDAGGNISDVCYNLYDRKKRTDFDLVTYIRGKVEFYCGGKMAVARVRLADFERFNATVSAIDEIPSILRDIDGVELSVVIREHLKKDSIRCNLRSKSYFDCATFAKSFGGGGHIRSSGFTKSDIVNETIDDIAEQVIARASEILK